MMGCSESSVNSGLVGEKFFGGAYGFRLQDFFYKRFGGLFGAAIAAVDKNI